MARRGKAEIEGALRRLLDMLAPLEGDRLPPERMLAHRLGCSRETLRAALAVLEGEGTLWRHVGQGTFRGARPRFLPLRDAVPVEGARPPDLMRARLLLEPQIAAEAARRAGPDDLVHLHRLVAEGRAARDRAACEQADGAFHVALAQVTGNPVLIGFLGFLAGARRRSAWQREWDRTYRRIGFDTFRGPHSDQHARIVAAVAAGAPERAAAEMAAHLDTVARAMAGPG